MNEIAKGANGYLWLATYDGLVRFDGLEFTLYRSGDYDGLPSNRITDLHTVQDELWLRTESRHLVRYREGKFQVLNDDPTLGDVFTVYQEPSGPLWIGTATGVYRFVNERFEPVAPDRITSQVEALLHASDGSLWVGTSGAGLYRRPPDGTWMHFTRDDGLAAETVLSLLEEPSGSIWIGAYPHVQRWRNGTLETIPYRGPIPNQTYGMLQIPGAPPWIGTSRGMLRMEEGEFAPADLGPVERTSQIYMTDSFRDGRFINTGRAVFFEGTLVYQTDDAVIETIYGDAQGNLWLGTNTNGLIRLQRSPITVVGAQEGLPSEIIYPILQRRDGSMWLGTLGGGLVELRNGRPIPHSLQKGSFAFENVWALHEGRSGIFWVGGPALCRFENGQCAAPNEPGPFGGTHVRSILEDRDGRLWVGTGNGVHVREDATDPSSPWRTYTPQNSNLPHAFIRIIRETPEGHLWIGTNGGGIAHYADGQFTAVTEADGLPSNLVREIHRDASGVFWIGTEDNGLARLELPEHGVDSSSVEDAFARAEITSIGKDDGLFDDVIHRIIEHDGRMWMSTNRGIFWVEKEQLEAFAAGELSEVQSVNYTTRSGMRSREANGGAQPAGVQADDGRIWFPTQGGAVVIDPDEVHRGTGPPPPTHIELITVDGQRIRPDTVEALTLRPGVNELTIHYTALEYSNPQNVHFRYQLEGLQSSWSEAGTRRAAYFTNLPPGEYRFRATARGAASEWNPTPARVTFTVEPFFYETSWFYALCVLLLGLGGSGLVRYRLHTHRRRAEELDRVVEERTQKLREEQQALRESEARLRAVFEDAAPGIAILNTDRQLQAMNPALEEMLDGNDGTLHGTRFEDLLASTFSATDEKRFDDVVQGNRRSYMSEYRFQRTDGSELWGQVSISRFPPQGDRAARLLAYVVDVTRRKQLEERLRQSQRMETVGTLTGGIAHEFNNVLHAASAYLELALDGNREESWDFVRRAHESLERASDLVEQLLTFTQQEGKENVECVDVSAVTRESIDLVEAGLPDDIGLRMNVPEAAAVRGDAGKIQQVLINLMTNAGQAMEDQDEDAILDVAVKTIAVDTDLAARHPGLDPGQHVCLNVSDTGPGMDAETKKNIFDPFFSTRDIGKGRGLGLAVVHGIVQAHDGAITVHSEPGCGTTFTVYLPALAEDASEDVAPTSASAPEKGTPPSKGRPRGHILVVEDDPHIRDLEHARLHRLGYSVTTCPDAKTALETLSTAPDDFDLILTDYVMPGFDGLALIRELRRRNVHLPAILMSIFPAHVAETDLHGAGVVAFVRKPVGEHELERVLSDATSRG